MYHMYIYRLKYSCSEHNLWESLYRAVHSEIEGDTHIKIVAIDIN